MITVAQVRKLALSLPEATEQDHWGNPSFRVRGKIFATMQEAEKTAVLKLTADEQDALTQGHPQVFTPIAWGTQCWTRVALARVERALFEELLVEGWRRLAPKRAIAAREGAGAPPSRAPKKKR